MFVCMCICVQRCACIKGRLATLAGVQQSTQCECMSCLHDMRENIFFCCCCTLFSRRPTTWSASDKLLGMTVCTCYSVSVFVCWVRRSRCTTSLPDDTVCPPFGSQERTQTCTQSFALASVSSLIPHSTPSLSCTRRREGRMGGAKKRSEKQANEDKLFRSTI